MSYVQFLDKKYLSQSRFSNIFDFHKPLKHSIKARNKKWVTALKDQNIIVEAASWRIKFYKEMFNKYGSLWECPYHHTFHRRWHSSCCSVEAFWSKQCRCQGRFLPAGEEPEQIIFKVNHPHHNYHCPDIIIVPTNILTKSDWCA